MAYQMTQREKKLVTFTAVFTAAALVLFLVILPGWDHWRSNRKQIRSSQRRLDEVLALTSGSTGDRTIENLAVAFESPAGVVEQMVRARAAFTEQVKKAGFKISTIDQIAGGGRDRVEGYDIVRFKCSATCQLPQLFDFLAGVYENPTLAGIEEVKFKCGSKNRNEIDLELVVSTLVKQKKS